MIYGVAVESATRRSAPSFVVTAVIYAALGGSATSVGDTIRRQRQIAAATSSQGLGQFVISGGLKILEDSGGAVTHTHLIGRVKWRPPSEHL